MTKRGKAERGAAPSGVIEQLKLNAAGLDVGAEEIYVCVPADRAEEAVRVFRTYTAGLYQLADWLTECRIETVAMESTGVYWIPVYEVLEERGFEVYLVNARHLKNVPGRKTDVLDCQWLQQLHTYGLLQPSFRPSENIRALRVLTRQRETLVRYQASHIRHMQKTLQQMNIKLTEAVSDITGVTGLRIIRAIVGGETDPQQLAAFRDWRCAKSESEIAQALAGHYKAEHLFVLKQALAEYDFYQQQIQECDRQLEALYAALPSAEPHDDARPPAEPHDDARPPAEPHDDARPSAEPHNDARPPAEPHNDARPPAEPHNDARPPSAKRHKRGKWRKNEPHFDLAGALYCLVGVDLTAIDGVDALTAQVIIAEIGTDVSAWRTVKHFTSWLGLAPCTEKTGGKVIRSRTKKTQNRANTAFRLAAQSLHHSKSALGAFYRRMKARLGSNEAITATAHKLARIVYHMLKNRTSYVDLGEDYYEQQYRERAVRNLRRKAAKLGFQLAPASTGENLVS